jgi:hypothetical protein
MLEAVQVVQAVADHVLVLRVREPAARDIKVVALVEHQAVVHTVVVVLVDLTILLEVP